MDQICDRPGARIAQRCICCNGVELGRSPAVVMPFVAKRVFGHDPVEITSEWGLRDLRPGMAYTVCNSLQCRDCGVLFLDYRFSNEQMAALYDGYRDAAYTRQRDAFEPGYAAVAAHYHGREAYIADVEKWLESYLPSAPKVMDWGGSSGINSPFLGRAELLHVHDISNVELVDGVQRVDPESAAGRKYDLVVCSQVLEHVSYPLEVIGQIRPVLGPETLLYIEVPYEALMRENEGSRDLARAKHHWHEHVNFFTPESIRRLLEKAGLQCVADHILPIDLGWRKGYVMGVLARLADHVD
jgi:SAM-dependent methyltransferase